MSGNDLFSGSVDKMDGEEQWMAVVEGEMERHMEAEVEAAGADMLVEGGEHELVDEKSDFEWKKYSSCRFFAFVEARRNWIESEVSAAR